MKLSEPVLMTVKIWVAPSRGRGLKLKELLSSHLGKMSPLHGGVD